MVVTQKLIIELSDGAAIPLLGIYPNESKTGIQTKTCTHMFIVVLFAIAQRQKQPKCSSADEWVDKL